MSDLRGTVASNRLWYHTLELAPGVVTPGWFDLRPIADRLPWPDVRGKRCLDVATYDGFLAFELERRGAAEVVATDIPSQADWDWPADGWGSSPEFLESLTGEEKGRGFEIAREALGSNVRREEINVYDLSPERVGEFDVVTCGTLLLHLRDPVGALERIRSVCRGELLSAEQVSLSLGLLHRRTPVARLRPMELQWWVPNAAGHRELVRAGGFEIVEGTRAYAVPFGPGHPRPPRRAAAIARRLLTGGTGVPHAALRAR